MSLRTLDGRWPLIESPLAWTAIHENYDVRWHDGSSALLERRPTPRRFESRVLSDEERGTGDEIPLPATDGLVFIRCDMRLNLRGRIARIFHQIPPVLLRAAFVDGLVVEGRCLPANLASETLVSFLPLPFRVEQTAEFIAGSGTNRVTRILFGGPGLAYYGKTMRVVLSEKRPAGVAVAGPE